MGKWSEDYGSWTLNEKRALVLGYVCADGLLAAAPSAGGIAEWRVGMSSRPKRESLLALCLSMGDDAMSGLRRRLGNEQTNASNTAVIVSADRSSRRIVLKVTGSSSFWAANRMRDAALAVTSDGSAGVYAVIESHTAKDADSRVEIVVRPAPANPEGFMSIGGKDAYESPAPTPLGVSTRIYKDYQISFGYSSVCDDPLNLGGYLHQVVPRWISAPATKRIFLTATIECEGDPEEALFVPWADAVTVTDNKPVLSGLTVAAINPALRTVMVTGAHPSVRSDAFVAHQFAASDSSWSTAVEGNTAASSGVITFMLSSLPSRLSIGDTCRVVANFTSEGDLFLRDVLDLYADVGFGPDSSMVTSGRVGTAKPVAPNDNLNFVWRRSASGAWALHLSADACAKMFHDGDSMIPHGVYIAPHGRHDIYGATVYFPFHSRSRVPWVPEP